MINYPLSFFGSSEGGPGLQTSWTTTSSGFDLNCSIPKEFEGDGTFLSPEDLFLLSLQNCFIATFKVFASYSKLQFEGISVRSELVVDKDDSGKPVMKKVILNIEIRQAADPKKAELIARKTLDNGFILRSVKTVIVPELTIT